MEWISCKIVGKCEGFTLYPKMGALYLIARRGSLKPVKTTFWLQIYLYSTCDCCCVILLSLRCPVRTEACTNTPGDPAL